MNIKKFKHGEAMASTEQQWGNVYTLKYSKPEIRIEPHVWLDLLSQALRASTEFGSQVINCRVRKEYDPQIFGAVLLQLGFHKKNERIEYKCDIEKLINDDGTPLIWKTMNELNWDHLQLASFIGEVVKDTLDVDPNEKPEDFMQDFLQHPELTYGPDCIAIGFLNDVPCAVVVAQIHVESGWSRLSYMGTTPAYRGQGLGQWVHRHGFTMMKAQGGKVYYGGTDARNLPMRKLFEKHGCSVFCEMEEWQR